MPNHLENDRIDPAPRADDRVPRKEGRPFRLSGVTSDLIRSAWSRFRAATSGSVAIAFALAAPFVVAVAGAAVEYSSLSNHRSQLQSAVDAATLAATRELSLSNANERTVEQVLQTVVEAHLTDAPNQPSIHGTIDRNAMTVSTEATMDVKLAFGSLFGMDAVTIGAHATGQAVGQPNVCVLAMHGSSSETISLNSSARVTGNGCAVFSNSESASGLEVTGQSLLVASTICTAGGYRGGDHNFTPSPFVDCPRFEDPLLHRQPPTFGGCDHNRFRVRGREVLSPGVYCGGINVNGNSEAVFLPGVYIIRDGEFKVNSHSTITGTDVGFYLSGANANFNFGKNSRVSLEAPLDGPMAGMLFFSDRAQSGSVRNHVQSNYVRNMVGTIYLPQAELHIEAQDSVADQSAYTAIVVNRLVMSDAPNLVLNTNYDETAVPVPDGIRGAGQPIRLIE
jgi:Flp pilus assembly protein TadG